MVGQKYRFWPFYGAYKYNSNHLILIWSPAVKPFLVELNWADDFEPASQQAIDSRLQVYLYGEI